jgi:hypothetical protein
MLTNHDVIIFNKNNLFFEAQTEDQMLLWYEKLKLVCI